MKQAFISLTGIPDGIINDVSQICIVAKFGSLSVHIPKATDTLQSTSFLKIEAVLDQGQWVATSVLEFKTAESTALHSDQNQNLGTPAASIQDLPSSSEHAPLNPAPVVQTPVAATAAAKVNTQNVTVFHSRPATGGQVNSFSNLSSSKPVVNSFKGTPNRTPSQPTKPPVNSFKATLNNPIDQQPKPVVNGGTDRPKFSIANSSLGQDIPF